MIVLLTTCITIFQNLIVKLTFIEMIKFQSIKLEEKNTYNQLLNIDGIGPDALNDIKNFFDDEKILIVKKLSKALDQIEEFKINKNVNSKISEKVIVFTGTLVKMSRSEAKTKAEELGAKVASAVSNNTDFVVVGKDSGSKEKKAKELNIKILKENDWIKLISK